MFEIGAASHDFAEQLFVLLNGFLHVSLVCELIRPGVKNDIDFAVEGDPLRRIILRSLEQRERVIDPTPRRRGPVEAAQRIRRIGEHERAVASRPDVVS